MNKKVPENVYYDPIDNSYYYKDLPGCGGKKWLFVLAATAIGIATWAGIFVLAGRV